MAALVQLETEPLDAALGKLALGQLQRGTDTGQLLQDTLHGTQMIVQTASREYKNVIQVHIHMHS